MEIPFDNIRRFGYQMVYNTDMIWFETCHCKGKQDEFYFFNVASGLEKAHEIITEFKKGVESCTRAFLIMQESDEFNLSYISRAHYGCREFSIGVRDRIIQSSLMSLDASWGRRANLLSQLRRSSEFTQMQKVTLSAQGRRHTASPLIDRHSPSPGPSPKHSPSPSPSPSPDMLHSPKRTLQEMQNRPSPHRMPKGSSSDGLDSGVTLDLFESSHHSAPTYLSPPSSKPPQFGSPEMMRRPTLDQFRSDKGTRKISAPPLTSAPPLPSRKPTLEQLYQDRVEGSYSRNFPSKDSCLGASTDLLTAAATSEGYDHLGPLQPGSSRIISSYDHLPPTIPPRSSVSLRNKHKEKAYVEA